MRALRKDAFLVLGRVGGEGVGRGDRGTASQTACTLATGIGDGEEQAGYFVKRMQRDPEIASGNPGWRRSERVAHGTSRQMECVRRQMRCRAGTILFWKSASFMGRRL